MIRGKWARATLGVILCATAITLPMANTAEAVEQQKHCSIQRNVDVQLLSLNDFHGQLNVTKKIAGKSAGRADYLAAYMKQREKENPNTLKVHAGDMVGASAPVSALLQDEPTIEFLNAINFDIGTLGNHEFDEGVKEMKRLIRGGYHEETGNFSGADFQYIAANVVNEKTGKRLFRPHTVRWVKGVPVGFIGVITKDAPNVITPEGIKGVKFLDEAKTINREVKKLKRKGVRAIVVLAHEGGFQDSKTGEVEGRIADIANNIHDEVDVILAGHSHSYLNTTIDNKLVVQSYSSGTAFADVDVTIDRRTRDIVKKKAEVVTTFHEGIEPDPTVKALIDRYEAKVAPIIDREIGQAQENLSRAPNAAGESVLGNLIADAQRWKTGTDIALMNPGGIRADIEEGTVTWGELYTVQPFNNDLVTMDMTGAQLKQLLNQQWGDSHSGHSSILQISGFTYTWDGSRAEGDRIIEVKKADGSLLTDEETLTVTANNFLASGGDGFTVFKEANNKTLGPVDLDALVDYVGQLDQPFTAQIEGRITQQ